MTQVRQDIFPIAVIDSPYPEDIAPARVLIAPPGVGQDFVFPTKPVPRVVEFTDIADVGGTQGEPFMYPSPGPSWTTTEWCEYRGTWTDQQDSLSAHMMVQDSQVNKHGPYSRHGL